jgi:energy-coupling factor transporter ATP-binding protein EcfA2
VVNRHCYIALDDVSLAGLKLAFFDPDIRLCFMHDERLMPVAVIEGVWVSGGFLRDQIFRLSDNITCFIGDTGSGKSLTLEMLRYALDQQVNPLVLDKVSTEVADLLDSNLSSLDSVNVVIRKDQDYYLVERPWLKGGTPPAPTVSRIVDGRPEALEEVIHLPTFFPIKGFSQTEIIEYAREPLARLSLVDDLIDVSSEVSSIEEVKGHLRQNATDVVTQQRLLQKSLGSLRELPGLKEEIGQLKTFLTNDTVRQRAAWATEEGVLKSAVVILKRLEESVRDVFPQLDDHLIQAEDLDENTPSASLQQELANLQSEIESTLASSQEALLTALSGSTKSLQRIRSSWRERFENAEREYRELFARLGTEERSQATLQVKLSKLEMKERELRSTERRVNNEIRPKVEELEARRDSLLTTLQATRRDITKKREAKASELTKALDGKVVIKVRSQHDSREFLRQLLELRTGSRVQESDLKVMAKELHPVPLVKSFLAGDFQTPAEKCGLQADTLERYLANIKEKGLLEKLFELQVADLPDGVEVRFAVEKETYRDLEKLAHGQKCTVVLMIALAEGDFPLLVDQPEDALHAPWIENYIATSLRARRGARQCVFATRNANVLVSADAEQIIAMAADSDGAVIDKTGALDRFDMRDLVIYHVEGGEDSFLRRQKKYGLNERGSGGPQ